MSMKLTTKIVKIMAPGSEIQAIGRGKYGHILKICLKKISTPIYVNI